MDKNYDFNSKKYIFLLIIVCLLFFILIIKAFQYLPEDYNQNEESNSIETNINTIKEPEPIQTQTENVKIDKPKRSKSGHIEFIDEDDINIDKLDEIEIPPSAISTEPLQISVDTTKDTAQISKVELGIKQVVLAKNLIKKSDYKNALKEYQKIAEITDDSEINAMAYEGIAEIYAKYKKYGTALSFAKKSNNLSPSVARQVLIAKIYYSAGKSEGAVKMMNNILKNGFGD